MILRAFYFAGLLALGLLGFGADALWADEYETLFLDRHSALSASQRLRAQVLGTSAGTRHGGYGWVRVRLFNPDEAGHTVRLTLVAGFSWSISDAGAAQGVVRTVRLEPGGSATVHLPLVNTRSGCALRAIVDGVPIRDEVNMGRGRSPKGAEASVLTVWQQDAGRSLNWTTFLESQAAPGRRGGSPLHIVAREPADLPDQWVLLSGFDLIVVDLHATGLTAEHQRLLARYVAGGGALVVLHAGSQGVLAQMTGSAAAETEATEGFHGLGRWILSPTDERPDRIDVWLRPGAGGGSYGTLLAAGRRFSGALPTPFWLPLEIPGLGDVPVKVFFFLILAFAIVVGPVNYIYFRRKRRLPMLLLTIPAAGFACTLVILAYGLFSEGFGVIGSTRTFSVLDQRDHTASTCTAQTLYAGLQPAVLRPLPGAFFCSSGFDLESIGREAGRPFRVTLDGGYSVAGRALPSRTQTPFLGVTVGRARERLRFRRRPDGAFDVLAAPAFLPREEAGALLLRTFDGAYYLMDEAGVLRPTQERGQEQEVSEPMGRMPVAGGDLPQEDIYYYGPRSTYSGRAEMQALALGPESLSHWMRWRVPRIRKGTYLARMQQPPVRETLGLEIEYRDERHVVLGLLAEEDLLDE